MKYVLGIDFGGGSSKTTLLSEDGTIAATSSKEYNSYTDAGGIVEQDPCDWYLATKYNVKNVLEKSGVSASDIVCISLDAATHTAVLLDENFTPIRRSIYWTDTRSLKQVNYLRKNYLEKIKDIMLHSPDTIWTLPQLLWVKENEPEVWRKTKRIMFSKDYVRHMITGDFATDYIEAEGSMLFDYNTLDWSEELLSIADITRDMLPELHRPDDIVGSVTKAAAEELGLCEGTPVLCGTTDTVMEVLASGSVKAGQMTIKLATAGRICIITDQPFKDRDIVNYSHVIKGLWYPGTATKACASSYRWYRDTFGEDYSVLDAGAEKIPAGCEGLIYHPYLNGELTPYADPLLCGSFTGIRFSHTKAHFSRAVMEGVALSLLDCKNKIEQLGIPHFDHAAIIGGGSYSPIWRQIVADTLNFKLIKKNNSDSSLGSAMMAGVVSCVFSSYEDAISKCTEDVCTTIPNEQNSKIYQKTYEKYKAIHDALADVYHKYSNI